MSPTKQKAFYGVNNDNNFGDNTLMYHYKKWNSLLFHYSASGSEQFLVAFSPAVKKPYYRNHKLLRHLYTSKSAASG